MTTEDTPVTETKPNTPNRIGTRRILYVLVFIVLLGLATGGVYYWQKQKVDSLNNKVNELNSAVTNLNQQLARLSNTETGTEDSEQEKTTSTQYVNGVALELPIVLGDLLTYPATDEISSISTSTLFSKEKELYGDAVLYCKAIDRPIMAIAVRDVSTPFPGHTLIKKLDSGKYLYHQDFSISSSCYQYREQLRDLISEQAQIIRAALDSAK